MLAAIRSSFAPLLCCLLGLACEGGEMGAPPGGSACDAERQPCTYFHDFGRTEVEAGGERTAQCYRFKLNNLTELG